MIKVNTRKAAMILVIAMLTTLFAGLGIAGAATTYETINTPILGPGDITNIDLGIIKIKMDTAIGVAKEDKLTVNMPQNITVDGGVQAVFDEAQIDRSTAGVILYVPAVLPDGGSNGLNIYTGNTRIGTIVSGQIDPSGKYIDIIFTGAGTGSQGLLYVYINKAAISALSADVIVSLMPSSSTFPMDTVTIAIYDSGGGVTDKIYPVVLVNTGTEATGAGDYKAGSIVTVSAGNPPAGMQFAAWLATGLTGSRDVTKNPLSFIMPDNIVALTPRFLPAGGSGGGGGFPSPPVFINNLPPTKTVIAGNSATFSVTAEIKEGATITYQWYKEAQALDGATAATYTINQADISHSGRYWALAAYEINGLTGINTIIASNLCELTVNSGPGTDPPIVNMRDVLLIYQYIRGEITLTADQLLAADVNNDSFINMQDVLLVYQYSRGKVNQFPVSQ